MTTATLEMARLREAAGTHLGFTDWQEMTQERVNEFADATDDHQFIHVDVERAKETPFGGTIAHGYLTLSIVPALLSSIVTIEGMSMGLNYGCNKVRFPSPLPVGAKVRLGAALQSVEEVAGGVQAIIGATIEVEGQEKPACVADVVYRYYD